MSQRHPMSHVHLCGRLAARSARRGQEIGRLPSPSASPPCALLKLNRFVQGESDQEICRLRTTRRLLQSGRAARRFVHGEPRPGFVEIIRLCISRDMKSERVSAGIVHRFVW